MSFLSQVFFFSILLLSSITWADSLSQEIIFEDVEHLGAVDCFKSGAGDYCQEKVPTFNQDGQPTQLSSNVDGACVEGGGACVMALFVLEKKDDQDGKTLVQVHSKKKDRIWIQVPTTEIKELESWIPGLSFGSNYVYFRKDLTEVFTDRNLSEKMSLRDFNCRALLKGTDEEYPDCEHQEISTFMHQGEKYIELEIRHIEKDPNLKSEDIFEILEKGKRRPLKRIYFPAYKSKGIINYWYQPMGC